MDNLERKADDLVLVVKRESDDGNRDIYIQKADVIEEKVDHDHLAVNGQIGGLNVGTGLHSKKRQTEAG